MDQFITSLNLALGAKIVIGEFQISILDAFDNDDFFVCTKQTLAYWMEIIQLTVSLSKEDILSKYLSKVAFSSYWSRRCRGREQREFSY